MSSNSKSSNKWFKTLKFIAAYLVAAWTFLQFVDWILNRYSISPYWVDLLLWLFIGIIPSLAIYMHHRERINKRILKLREKIIFPLNIILLFIIIYFGFGNSDLGATTKEIKYTDEQGQSKSELITKEEFRIGIPIYGFKDLNEDESHRWMRYGIGRLLVEDLNQNKSLSPDFSFFTDTSTKIEESSLFNDFYIDGNYKKIDNQYSITVYKRKSTNGKILIEKTFLGKDFLPLIDNITVFITENSGFVETKALRYLDYPINEFMSNSIEAIKEFINGNYSKATRIDEEFALAYLDHAKQSLRISKGKLEIQDLTDKAFMNRNRLPLQKQLEVQIQRNLAYDNFELAAKQVKLQLEVDPHNSFYNQVLFSIYGETKQTDKFLKSSERLFDIDRSPETGTNLAIAAMANGNDDMLIDEIKKYEIISPSLKVFKLQPLLFRGRIKESEILLEDIKTLFPYYKSRASVYDSALVYLKNNTYNISKFEKFEGTYRSSTSEQTHTYWIENNRLLQYVKNQKMYALLPAGDNSLVNGFVNNSTYRYDLVEGVSGKPIGIKFSQYNYNNMFSIWYWKEDDAIKNARHMFDNGDYDKAEILYTTAINENPNHAYLKKYLQHIQYIKEIPEVSIVMQHNRFVGDYGPRQFWVEDGSFFYKRKSESVDLPKVELLAIAKNQYMDITRANTLMYFETTDNGSLASVSYSYNVETEQWERTAEGDNYFVKNAN